MKNNKKGISAIVATVLIILITVAAVTIIWAAIIPMIQDQIGGSTECFDASAALVVKADNSCVNYSCSDSSYIAQGSCESSHALYLAPPGGVPPTCTNPTWAPPMNPQQCISLNNVWTSSVAVQVHRGTGNFELEGLEIIVGSGGNTESVKFTNGIGDGVPDKNGDHVYTITPSTLTGTINEASVAAIVTSGNTQKTCEKSGIVTISPCL